jgi:hypothetical protein
MTRPLNWIDLAVWKSLPKIESNSYRYKTEFYLRFLNGEKEKKWSEKKRESGPMRELLLCFFFLSFWAILLCVMWETLLFFRAVIRNKTNGLLRRKTISSGKFFFRIIHNWISLRWNKTFSAEQVQHGGGPHVCRKESEFTFRLGII